MISNEDKDRAAQPGEQNQQSSARPKGGGGVSGRDLTDVTAGSGDSTGDSDSASSEQNRRKREKPAQG